MCTIRNWVYAIIIFNLTEKYSFCNNFKILKSFKINIKCHEAVITGFKNLNTKTIQKIRIILNESQNLFKTLRRKIDINQIILI